MSKKKTPPKTKGQHVSAADKVRLGAQVAAMKEKTDAKTWKKIVADAHARGRTVKSQLFEGDMPDALRERTRSSLAEEAEKNIAEAYKPQEAMLDTQQQRAQALSAKRAADNISYRTWMDQQATAQAAQAAGAQQRYEQYIAQQAVPATGQLQGQAQAAAQATPGTVSDLSQSTAVKGLSADEARSQANVANARAQTAAMIPSTQMQQQNLALAARASYDAAESQRRGDTNKDLNDVFDARQKTTASRAADKIKEVARLFDNEQAKASGNRDYAAAAEKLGLDSFKAHADAANNAATLKIKTKQFNLDTWIAQNKVATDRAKLKLDYDKIKERQGKAAADRALRKYLGDQKHRDSVADRDQRATDNAADRAQGNATDARNSSTADQTVNTIYGSLTDLHKSHPAGTVSPAGHPISFREYLRSQGYSDLQIDVAEDMRKHGGKLSAAGVAKAKRIGIKNPESTIGKA